MYRDVRGKLCDDVAHRDSYNDVHQAESRKRDATDARIGAPEWVKRDGARGLKPRPNAAVYVNKARVVSHTN